MSLIGMDIGSTNCKAILFDAEGNQLATASREYAEVYPGPAMIELRPDDVWSAICEVLRKVSGAAGGDPVQAVSFSALGEAFTPVGKSGEFLYNTIVSPDNRAVDEANSWRDTLGAERMFEITGMPLHPSFSLNKIMWLREHRPEVHKQTWKYLLWPDIIFYKLGLEPRLDWSLAGRTMCFDVVNKCWAEEVLEVAGISSDMLAEPIRPGSVVGQISAEASVETGLPKGCLVVAGGHDQPMNALGAGIIREGMAVDGHGPSSASPSPSRSRCSPPTCWLATTAATRTSAAICTPASPSTTLPGHSSAGTATSSLRPRSCRLRPRTATSTTCS